MDCSCLLVPVPTVVHASRVKKGILRLTCTSPSAPVTQECPWYLWKGAVLSFGLLSGRLLLETQLHCLLSLSAISTFSLHCHCA